MASFRLCFLVAVVAPQVAFADEVRDFYSAAGNEIRVVVRSNPGTGYDQLSRLLARHMGRHIPGDPNLIAINMPGGGGIVAANYLANVAPKDGTVLSIVGQGLVADQALGLSPQLKADVRQFNWLGNLQSSNQMLVVWSTSSTKTLEDAKRRKTTIGATGAGSASVHYPAFYNQVLGTKFEIVFGYRGGGEINLAMERGEVEGRGTNTYASYLSATPHYIEKSLIRPLIQIGLVKNPAIPDVPLLLDQPVEDRDKDAVAFMSKAATMGRPLATTPAVPAERVRALRAAFAKMLEDPAFIGDAKKMQAEIDAMSGEETQQLVNEILDVRADVRSRIITLIKPRDEDARKK